MHHGRFRWIAPPLVFVFAALAAGGGVLGTGTKLAAALTPVASEAPSTEFTPQSTPPDDPEKSSPLELTSPSTPPDEAAATSAPELPPSSAVTPSAQTLRSLSTEPEEPEEPAPKSLSESPLLDDARAPRSELTSQAPPPAPKPSSTPEAPSTPSPPSAPAPGFAPQEPAGGPSRPRAKAKSKDGRRARGRRVGEPGPLEPSGPAPPSRPAGSVRIAATLEPIAARIRARSRERSAPSKAIHRGQSSAPSVPSLPRPDLFDDRGEPARGWVVVAASWGVAVLVVMSLIAFNRLFRLRRQK